MNQQENISEKFWGEIWKKRREGAIRIVEGEPISRIKSQIENLKKPNFWLCKFWHRLQDTNLG